MPISDELTGLSKQMETILCPPFEWCPVAGSTVTLQDASDYGGSTGGTYQVAEFAIGKYLITNGQYQKFTEHPHGFRNAQWWDFSTQAVQWRKDHRTPKPTAFAGQDMPRTRLSWFDSMAFCRWLSAELNIHVRLPANRQCIADISEY